MDILTHALSGVAAGTVIVGFSKKGLKAKAGITLFAALGGILPDLDAISLWSRFDGTIGKLFGLSHTGKEIYSSKFWYSHHGFLHSIFAGILIGLLIGTTIYLISNGKNKLSYNRYKTSLKDNMLLMAGFFLGFVIHSLQDMLTPSSVWGGVNLFWPSSAYIGGTGEIWWWNNYDLFLIVIAVIAVNSVILSVRNSANRNRWKLTLFVFLAGSLITIIQVKTRSFDFNYTGNTPRFQEYEQKSKDIQKEILGERLYTCMAWFDSKVKGNF